MSACTSAKDERCRDFDHAEVNEPVSQIQCRNAFNSPSPLSVLTMSMLRPTGVRQKSSPDFAGNSARPGHVVGLHIMSKDKCFIIMPVSTPGDMVKAYRDDPDHFKHVLEDLFCPAVDKAGFEPVLPIAEGNDLIHARIIQQINDSAMALCDMSRLNPNVFFELGIRTAMNKSVAMVVDDITPKVPFDTAILNHHVYASSMEAYVVKREIPKLVTHIEKSAKHSNGTNSMWKYFGLHASATLVAAGSTPKDVQIARLASEVEAMRKQMSMSSPTSSKPVEPKAPPMRALVFVERPDGSMVDLNELWQELLQAVGRSSTFTRSYLNDLCPVSLKSGVLTIGYDAEFADQVELVNNQKTQTLLFSKLAELGFPSMKDVKFVLIRKSSNG